MPLRLSGLPRRALGQNVKVPVLVQDDSGIPLQSTAVVGFVQMDRGWNWVLSAPTSNFGDTTIEVREGRPVRYMVVPPTTHQIEPSFADVARNPDGSLVITARRELTSLEATLKSGGLLMAGAGLGIAAYIGLRWFLKKESPL
jgi:hypothetical protein